MGQNGYVRGCMWAPYLAQVDFGDGVLLEVLQVLTEEAHLHLGTAPLPTTNAHTPQVRTRGKDVVSRSSQTVLRGIFMLG